MEFEKAKKYNLGLSNFSIKEKENIGKRN